MPMRASFRPGWAVAERDRARMPRAMLPRTKVRRRIMTSPSVPGHARAHGVEPGTQVGGHGEAVVRLIEYRLTDDPEVPPGLVVLHQPVARHSFEASPGGGDRERLLHLDTQDGLGLLEELAVLTHQAS